MTMNSIRTKLYTAIGVLFGSAAAGGAWTSAQASEPPPPSMTVKFADVDIQTAAGAKVLYHRIRLAADEVCTSSSWHDPILREAESQCVNTAIDNAVRRVNAPFLTALRFGESNVRLASRK
jgi:UrcA family protein